MITPRGCVRLAGTVLLRGSGSPVFPSENALFRMLFRLGLSFFAYTRWPPLDRHRGIAAYEETPVRLWGVLG